MAWRRPTPPACRPSLRPRPSRHGCSWHGTLQRRPCSLSAGRRRRWTPGSTQTLSLRGGSPLYHRGADHRQAPAATATPSTVGCSERHGPSCTTVAVVPRWIDFERRGAHSPHASSSPCTVAACTVAACIIVACIVVACIVVACIVVACIAPASYGVPFALAQELLAPLLLCRYSLTVVGHSLGAAVAVLITAILKFGERATASDPSLPPPPPPPPPYDHIDCIAFAAPACVDQALADRLRPCVIAAVHNDDVVPRLSDANLHQLACDLRDNDPEYRYVLYSCCAGQLYAIRFPGCRPPSSSSRRDRLRGWLSRGHAHA